MSARGLAPPSLPLSLSLYLFLPALSSFASEFVRIGRKERTYPWITEQQGRDLTAIAVLISNTVSDEQAELVMVR